MSNSILPPSFLTYTLGCRVNQAETSVISSQLLAHGFKSFIPALPLLHSPALIIINTCAVTQKAERESRKAIHHFKRLYPKAKIIALGCAAKFVKDADLVVRNQQKMKSLEIIFQKFPELKASRAITQRSKYLQNCSLTHQSSSLASSSRALVKIQEGCDQFCNYCIVPYLRGKPKSATPEEIICKINNLVDEGIKEIILCGVNLSLYGTDFSTSPRFARNYNLLNLIKKILKKTVVERISLSSIEPEYLYQNQEFAKLFFENPRLSKYFHLALQSGSSETLSNMGRKTDLKKLLKSIKFIKERCPEFTFRADIMVGFPTETEKSFQDTLKFIRKAPISIAHVFRYSVRPNTLAAQKIKNKEWVDISPQIKKERAKKVVKIVKKINAKK